MAVNVVLSAGKMVAGFFGHSHALIADGVESLADIFSSVIVWRGMVIASEPADADHPYGHGKAEPLAAALVALMLLLAAFWIASHAVATAFNPHQPPAVWTLPVLLFVVVVKETLFRFVLREGDSVESSAVQSDAWHHRSDAITSCFAAAGIGVDPSSTKVYTRTGAALPPRPASTAAPLMPWLPAIMRTRPKDPL